jgi:hypothetical protein
MFDATRIRFGDRSRQRGIAGRRGSEYATATGTRAILAPGRSKMNQPNEDAAAKLKREHEAAKQRLESLREEAKKPDHGFEEKLKEEILEAEVELTRLSGMLGQIGL